MKILFAFSASQMDNILNDYSASKRTTYDGIIEELGAQSLFATLGFDYKRQDKDHFLAIINSRILQGKWIRENNLKPSPSWRLDVLSEQIRKFEPDVLYTNNAYIMNSNFCDKLPNVKLKAIWIASPIRPGLDLSHFDLGFSFSEIFLQRMKQCGLDNIFRLDFCFNTDLSIKSGNISRKKYDLCFVGRYGNMFSIGRHGNMFSKRNKSLYIIYKELGNKYRIKYHFLKSPFPKCINFKHIGMLFSSYPPVYLKDMFEVFAESKIVLNAHSDVTGKFKGNMRTFEVLGSNNFMLTDDGGYPKNLNAGRDFIIYKDTKDLIKNIQYYLNEDKARENIAQRGFETVQKNYSMISHNIKMIRIFQKVLRRKESD